MLFSFVNYDAAMYHNFSYLNFLLENNCNNLYLETSTKDVCTLGEGGASTIADKMEWRRETV